MNPESYCKLNQAFYVVTTVGLRISTSLNIRVIVTELEPGTCLKNYNDVRLNKCENYYSLFVPKMHIYIHIYVKLYYKHFYMFRCFYTIFREL